MIIDTYCIPNIRDMKKRQEILYLHSNDNKAMTTNCKLDNFFLQYRLLSN
jgi:hypothetical protein